MLGIVYNDMHHMSANSWDQDISRIKAREIAESEILKRIAEHIELLTNTAYNIIQYPGKITPEYRVGLMKYLAMMDKYKLFPKGDKWE